MWTEWFGQRFDPPASTVDWAHGVDISGHQPNYSPGPEDAYGIIKLSEGASYRSAESNAQVARFLAAGVPVGGYHFAGKASAASEAANYIGKAQAIGVEAFTLPHVLDLEALSASGGVWVTPGGWDAWAVEWSDRVEQALGRAVMIYTARWWSVPAGLTTTVGGRDLWVANYAPAGASAPWLPPQWDTWAMWQWTSGGPFGLSLDRNVCDPNWLARVTGQPGAGPVRPGNPTWTPGNEDEMLTPFTIDGGSTVFLRNPASGRSERLELLMPHGFNGDPMDVLREAQSKALAAPLMDISSNVNWMVAAIDGDWSKEVGGADPTNPRPAQDR